ncbi:MAG: hypothetical protein LBE82_09235 [Chitinophagaceae bacterium]|jgi:hypothetical protein|nr:hypothetical protein [Chitinophagaceae bacterium]
MDRKQQLKVELQPFFEACRNQGKPFSEICFLEAYPGDRTTSFRIKVKAPWFEGKTRWEIIDLLFDILFETTTANTRGNIFSIEVVYMNDELPCVPETPELENQVHAHA